MRRWMRELVPPVLFVVLLVFLTGVAVGEDSSSYEYAQTNLLDLHEYRLDNGIPVIIKVNKTNRVFALKTVFTNPAAFTPPGKAGLESIALSMLPKGSAKYSFDEIQRIIHETSSSLSPNYSSFDLASFDLITLGKYFDKLLDVYVDSLTNPAWNSEEFERVIGTFKIRRQNRENDPYSLSVIKLHDQFFAGHPYEADFSGSLSSLESISLEDVKNHYPLMLAPARMIVVGVGDFDAPKLLDVLNSTIGTLESQGPSTPAIPPLKVEGGSRLIKEPFAASEGLAFVRGDFPVVHPSHPDYPALSLACSMLDDLLFEFVRIQHGASYGAQTNLFSFQANYAAITIYKTSVPETVKQYIDDAVAVLLDGKSLAANVSASAAGKGGVGGAAEAPVKEVEIVPIADSIDFYKAQFLSQFYAKQQTNSSIAYQIASSVYYQNSYKDYLFFIDRINAVEPPDIVRAVEESIANNNKMWIVLGPPDLLEKVREEDYR